MKLVDVLGQLRKRYVSYGLSQLLHTLLPTQRKGSLSQRSRTH